MICTLLIFSSRNFSYEFGNSSSYFWGNDFCFFLLLVRLFGHFNLSILRTSSHFKWEFLVNGKNVVYSLLFCVGQMRRYPLPHTKYFTIWTKWATTPTVCVIYPNSMIYLPVQFYALYPVLSGVIMIFNTKCLIMPHTTLLTQQPLKRLHFKFTLVKKCNTRTKVIHFSINLFIVNGTWTRALWD